MDMDNYINWGEQLREEYEQLAWHAQSLQKLWTDCGRINPLVVTSTKLRYYNTDAHAPYFYQYLFFIQNFLKRRELLGGMKFASAVRKYAFCVKTIKRAVNNFIARRNFCLFRVLRLFLSLQPPPGSANGVHDIDLLMKVIVENYLQYRKLQRQQMRWEEYAANRRFWRKRQKSVLFLMAARNEKQKELEEKGGTSDNDEDEKKPSFSPKSPPADGKSNNKLGNSSPFSSPTSLLRKSSTVADIVKASSPILSSPKKFPTSPNFPGKAGAKESSNSGTFPASPTMQTVGGERISSSTTATNSMNKPPAAATVEPQPLTPQEEHQLQRLSSLFDGYYSSAAMGRIYDAKQKRLLQKKDQQEKEVQKKQRQEAIHQQMIYQQQRQKNHGGGGGTGVSNVLSKSSKNNLMSSKEEDEEVVVEGASSFDKIEAVVEEGQDDDEGEGGGGKKKVTEEERKRKSEEEEERKSEEERTLTERLITESHDRTEFREELREMIDKMYRQYSKIYQENFLADCTKIIRCLLDGEPLTKPSSVSKYRFVETKFRCLVDEAEEQWKAAQNMSAEKLKELEVKKRHDRMMLRVVEREQKRLSLRRAESRSGSMLLQSTASQRNLMMLDNTTDVRHLSSSFRRGGSDSVSNRIGGPSVNQAIYGNMSTQQRLLNEYLEEVNEGPTTNNSNSGAENNTDDPVAAMRDRLEVAFEISRFALARWSVRPGFYQEIRVKRGAGQKRCITSIEQSLRAGGEDDEEAANGKNTSEATTEAKKRASFSKTTTPSSSSKVTTKKPAGGTLELSSIALLAGGATRCKILLQTISNLKDDNSSEYSGGGNTISSTRRQKGEVSDHHPHHHHHHHHQTQDAAQSPLTPSSSSTTKKSQQLDEKQKSAVVGFIPSSDVEDVDGASRPLQPEETEFREEGEEEMESSCSSFSSTDEDDNVESVQDVEDGEKKEVDDEVYHFPVESPLQENPVEKKMDETASEEEQKKEWSTAQGDQKAFLSSEQFGEREVRKRSVIIIDPSTTLPRNTDATISTDEDNKNKNTVTNNNNKDHEGIVVEKKHSSALEPNQRTTSSTTITKGREDDEEETSKMEKRFWHKQRSSYRLLQKEVKKKISPYAEFDRLEQEYQDGKFAADEQRRKEEEERQENLKQLEEEMERQEREDAEAETQLLEEKRKAEAARMEHEEMLRKKPFRPMYAPWIDHDKVLQEKRENIIAQQETKLKRRQLLRRFIYRFAQRMPMSADEAKKDLHRQLFFQDSNEAEVQMWNDFQPPEENSSLNIISEEDKKEREEKIQKRKIQDAEDEKNYLEYSFSPLWKLYIRLMRRPQIANISQVAEVHPDQKNLTMRQKEEQFQKQQVEKSRNPYRLQDDYVFDIPISELIEDVDRNEWQELYEEIVRVHGAKSLEKAAKNGRDYSSLLLSRKSSRLENPKEEENKSLSEKETAAHREIEVLEPREAKTVEYFTPVDFCKMLKKTTKNSESNNETVSILNSSATGRHRCAPKPAFPLLQSSHLTQMSVLEEPTIKTSFPVHDLSTAVTTSAGYEETRLSSPTVYHPYSIKAVEEAVQHRLDSRPKKHKLLDGEKEFHTAETVAGKIFEGKVEIVDVQMKDLHLKEEEGYEQWEKAMMMMTKSKSKTKDDAASIIHDQEEEDEKIIPKEKEEKVEDHEGANNGKGKPWYKQKQQGSPSESQRSNSAVVGNDTPKQVFQGGRDVNDVEATTTSGKKKNATGGAAAPVVFRSKKSAIDVALVTVPEWKKKLHLTSAVNNNTNNKKDHSSDLSKKIQKKQQHVVDGSNYSDMEYTDQQSLFRMDPQVHPQNVMHFSGLQLLRAMRSLALHRADQYVRHLEDNDDKTEQKIKASFKDLAAEVKQVSSALRQSARWSDEQTNSMFQRQLLRQGLLTPPSVPLKTMKSVPKTTGERDMSTLGGEKKLEEGRKASSSSPPRGDKKVELKFHQPYLVVDASPQPHAASNALQIQHSAAATHGGTIGSKRPMSAKSYTTNCSSMLSTEEGSRRSRGGDRSSSQQLSLDEVDVRVVSSMELFGEKKRKVRPGISNAYCRSMQEIAKLRRGGKKLNENNMNEKDVPFRDQNDNKKDIKNKKSNLLKSPAVETTTATIKKNVKIVTTTETDFTIPSAETATAFIESEHEFLEEYFSRFPNYDPLSYKV